MMGAAYNWAEIRQIHNKQSFELHSCDKRGKIFEANAAMVVLATAYTFLH